MPDDKITANLSLPSSLLDGITNTRTRKMIDAQEHEIRLPLDPDDENTDFLVILPTTSSETTYDPVSGKRVSALISELQNSGTSTAFATETEAIEGIITDKAMSPATTRAATENLIKNAAIKTSLDDADSMPLIDSESSDALKKITWANVKSDILKEIPSSSSMIQLEITFDASFIGKAFSVSATDFTTFNGTVPSEGVAKIPVTILNTTYTVTCDGVSNTVDVGAYFGVYSTSLGIYKTYGVRHYKTQSLTTLERIYDSVGLSFSPSIGVIAGYSDFDNIYPWSEIKSCNVVSGAVTYYENEAGFSRNPAIGDVMVEIPAYYYKVEDSALFRDYIIASNKPGVDPQPEGFLLSPRHMGTPGNPDGWDKIYTSVYSLNSQYRSISGNNSLVNISRTTARTGCRNRGTQYHLDDFATYWTRNLLYLVEVADWNSQLAVGPGYTDAGNTAQIATGGADAVAWHSGRASGNSNAAKNAVKYRGMENLWGNLFTWCDGINFNGSTTYVNLNPATYADDSAVGSALSYTKATADGFQKVLGFDSNYPFAQICTDATGADGTFISDYYYQGTGWRALFLGGSWFNAGYAGLFAFSSYYAASYVTASIGARLLVLP